MKPEWIDGKVIYICIWGYAYNVPYRDKYKPLIKKCFVNGMPIYGCFGLGSLGYGLTPREAWDYWYYWSHQRMIESIHGPIQKTKLSGNNS